MTADRASIHSRVSWLSASCAAEPNKFSGTADMLVSWVFLTNLTRFLTRRLNFLIFIQQFQIVLLDFILRNQAQNELPPSPPRNHAAPTLESMPLPRPISFPSPMK